jgi:hypothetical protein
MLSNYQEKLLANNVGKTFEFHLPIYDCEHIGDIHHEENRCEHFCKVYGGKVCGHYWDGSDCGEAYIICRFPYDMVRNVMETEFFNIAPFPCGD